MERKAAYNMGLAKVAVQCSADTFVVNQSLVLRINICGVNRHLRQARNRYMPLYKNTLMTKRKISGLIFLIVLLSVTFYLGIRYESYKQSQIEESFSMNDTGIPINELKTKALEKGDTIAYWNLTTEYLDFATEDFLPIALEMANGQNYPRAYFDVYSTITEMNGLNEEQDNLEEWKNLNPKMTRIALDHLLNGAKLGEEQSIETVKNYYLNNKKLNSILMSHKDLVIEYSNTIEKIK